MMTKEELLTMWAHAAIWNKLQTNLTLSEAVEVSTVGLLPDAYVSSDGVFRLTRGYHHSDPEKLKRLYYEILKAGHDVVDDDMENIYRCIRNIDGEGDEPDMIHLAADDVKKRVNGKLLELGLGKDGVLSTKPYGGVAALKVLMQKHPLI